MDVLAEIEAFTKANPAASTEDARRERRRISAALKDAEPGAVKAMAMDLRARPGFWSRYFAYEILSHHPKAFGLLTEEEIEALGEGIDSWGAVDMFGCYIAGPAWRADQASDERIQSWTRSPDRWWRRAALVSTVPLNVKAQGGTGDLVRTLDICERLMHDRDDMVVKALSWALRALAKPCPDAVREWIERHRGHLAARVVREVENKLTTGRKNRK